MYRWVITHQGRANLSAIDDSEVESLFDQFQTEIEAEKYSWNNTHSGLGYAGTVISVTDDTQVCEDFCIEINEQVKHILIPGCGSKIHLQQYITEHFPHIKSIHCTDWSQDAIDIAQQDYSHDKITYSIEDSTKLSFLSNQFDYVITSNSVLSSNDLANRKMIQEFYRVLKPSGFLRGLYPSVYFVQEIAYLDKKFSHLATDGSINIAKSSLYESKNDQVQILYTPLRLKEIFESAGFKRKTFEVYFLDTPHFLAENERIYHISPDSGLCVWEFMVTFVKP
ncbi:methyltransferase domain-containing protein [Candidatus Albibeggiatoa sp. nov. NOAA]|uniref:class I SAM-dependent methyltransferase n=1 Tax=Candidatus Albibeggiatoa sp. nov. NOAA TaxID=3162724 RepID=UPI0032F8B7B0|nr:class I SAM-dependent methyltransferase [Thiotrichaceae bacterium]